MSQPIYNTTKEKELDIRGIPLDTIVTPDNCQLLITRESLRCIANIISSKINRKLTPGEVDNLIKYSSQIPLSNFQKISFQNAYNKIAQIFLSKQLVSKQQYDNNKPNNVDNLVDEDSLSLYQQHEIKQLTQNENQYKYAQFADRRGNAFIDNERVSGTRSSPNNILSGKKISSDDLIKNNYETFNLLKKFLDPNSIETMINKISSSYTNFNSICLPHQIVPLDSRNRLLSNNNNYEYTWNIHTAGNPGRIGDIKIQDTLQQAIQMNITPFWLPMYPTAGSYYGKIRLLVKEFISQSIIGTEFINDEIMPYYYHFEFDITQTVGNKVFLSPVKKSFSFRKPFARIETLTISFRTPFDLLTFIPDRGIYTITYGNPTVLTITSDPDHLLNTGDLVYLSNVNSTSNLINTALNKQSGWIITVINNTQFSVIFDSSSIVGSNNNVNIYYGSQRIFFNLEFLNLEQ